jgi:hypothetical protein
VDGCHDPLLHQKQSPRMHGCIIRCSGRFLLPIGKYNDARHWGDSMVHRQRHVGNIRTWSKEVGVVCPAVHLHGAEYFCGVECFYGRGDMNSISEESDPGWLVMGAIFMFEALLLLAFGCAVVHFFGGITL